MCGITGVFVLGGGRPADAAVVREMTACLVHRGPDDDGHYATDGLCLGFRRLALNDLAGGNQPHRTEDGTLVSVCNGEIYNHRELRTALSRRGHRFRTESDTEVLVHLYREYGEDLTAHLDGQFGFALHDAGAQRLLLARDRAGIVPLFYTVADGQLIFASEIKAILRHPAVSARVDLRGLDQVLTLPGLVSPRTMFEGISALRPGERLIADRSGVRTERYWDLDFPLAADLDPVAPEALDQELERYAHRTADLLDEAVRSRLLADVPIGMYLSGGLDSSLIGALMARARPGHAWPSFSVTFPGRDFDEGPHQRLVAAKLGTEHHEVPVGEHEVAERITAMVRHAEAPVRESYNVCSLALSEAVRAAGTVGALSGEGADELFGGYPGYRFDATGLGGSRLTGLDARLEREIRERMWGVDLGYEQDQLPAQEFRRELYAEDLAYGLDEFSVTNQRLVDPERLAGRHPLHQRSYLDYHLRLADHLLGDHGDRMALANGVELRFPFLANAVVDHATTLPPELMLAHGREKAVLRRAAEGLVPGEVLSRQKYGFRGQTSSHLLSTGADWFEELVSPATVRRQGYFNPDTIAALTQRQRGDGQQVHAHLDTDYLMLVATFALFVEEFDLPCLG
ncbi:asparagine synthase (glutamine-hydrolyzing) [Kitasatospora sp. NPDC059811]|uniref:asparagine synthase (glutamine-hydrolyzing) n=1 Tax=Streptomycetaceae TaxID=2062 RepID=UPI0007AF602B|nr:asparagine synthase (glutamine-hydrolyzing) [Streptomyces sp. MJM8645]